MIRTAISFLALFGSLLLISKALTESQAQDHHEACCSGDVRSDECDAPQLASAEVQLQVESTLRSIEAHQLTAVALPGDLVLLPVSSADEQLVENEGETAAADIRDAAVTPVVLQTTDEQPLSRKTPASRPQRIHVGGAPATVATEVTPIDDEDRPIGSGVREELAENSDVDAADPQGDAEASEEAAAEEEPFEEEAAEAQSADDESPSEEAATEQTPEDDTSEKDETTQNQPQEQEPAPIVQLDPEMLRLRDKVRNVLAYHIERPEAVEERSPWGIMHALIAYGVDTEVTQGNRRVNAIGWMCFNGPCRGQQLLYSENGRLRTKQGPGVQGHEGQFLAMLAQSKVKLDFPIRIDGNQYTVADLVEYEKRTCVENTELTFKLIGLSHYLDTDAKWKTVHGEDWDLPKLIKEELAQPVIGAACGGTHRMMGFSYAVKKREKQGRPITGQWLRAKKYVDSYHEYTFKLQNDNGSFSTNWFREPGEFGTVDRYIETSGHTLEWMVYSLPDDQLKDPRTVKAVNFLASLMWDNREHEWEIGPKGHALHALAMYDERVFQGKPGQRRVQLAEHRRTAAAAR